MRETTSLGAAIAAAFACNIYKDFDELKNINRENRKIFRPRKSKVESKAMFKKWQKAVEMCRGWVDEEEKEAEMEKIHRETSGMSTY
jgi:glycerol kinase